MNDIDITKLLSSISFNNQIDSHDIPNIDLYMDQITTFMDNHFKKYKRNDSDKIITKTMVNNYTKNNVIPSPIKKKYSKNHMILLLLTFHLKHTLSINDIKILLTEFNENYKNITSDIDLNKFSNNLENFYETFIDLESDCLGDISDNTNKLLSAIDDKLTCTENNNEKSKLLLLVLLLVTQSNIQKFLAERIIDDFFTEK